MTKATSTTLITDYNANLYTGRAEPFEPAIAQYWYQHIKANDSQKIGLLGFASDQGVQRNKGRIGAKHAPDKIKSALAVLPISRELQAQCADLSNLVGDHGNICCHDDDVITENALEQAQTSYSEQMSEMIATGQLAIGLGGGHEIAWGSFLGLYQGLEKLKQNQSIGIINLDAHFDLRNDQYATSGTPFRQISEFLHAKNQPFHYLTIGISQFGNTAALFERAENLGVKVISDDDCYRLDWQDIASQIQAFINQVDVIYLTIDMDCLSGSVMPAVSAVAAKGLSLDFVERCVSLIIDSGKVKIIDMAEVSPKYDIDGRGLKVAGRLLAVMIEKVLMQAD
ncbi:formimidoylglutamase [Acinetobacter sp. c2-A9]|uniref:formimidoylglutamase n=1 Tax=Acinetobacter sp. c2-A9 TaxID=3342802 RepID=UPI0035B8B243